MTKSNINLDQPDAIRRFISQIKGQSDLSNMTDIPTSISSSSSSSSSSSPPNQNEQLANRHGQTINTADSKHIGQHNNFQGARTPPYATIAHQDHLSFTSPEPHPKPSPHISGLTAPYNTPKTATSSPRLTTPNTHNEDVAEAFSDFVNKMEGKPLSQSMWAPGSARYKPSTLDGARTTRVLVPIKAVEPNPAINETFERMSFIAADPNHKMNENLIGDSVTKSLFSKAPPSFANEFSVLADQIREYHGDDVPAKSEAASEEGFDPPAHIGMVKTIQVKAERASKENLPNTTHADQVVKENDAPPTSSANLPPHLRARAVSSHKTVKAETNSSDPGGSFPGAMGKVVDAGPVENAVRAVSNSVEPKATTVTVGAKPMVGSESENLEHKTFFTAWPTLEGRNKPAAKVRKVFIKNLPRDSTVTFVASLVYGGPIEEINLRSSATGDLSAFIRFIDAEDCMRFYVETSNGLVYKKDDEGREHVVFVELSKDVDVVGGLLQGWIASGVTRCVRAVGVEAEWDMSGLRKIAERKNRKVEKIVDGQNPGGARSVVFRFCKVEDAVKFKAALSRDEEWEHCNIHYAADPCAAATGVHYED